jgi:hypothetical protein
MLHQTVDIKKCNEQWFPHHDNTPSHTSLVVQQFLTEKSIPVITQPPHPLDLVMNDYWLLPTLKMSLRLTHFATMDVIRSNAMAELQKISKEAFCQCFQQWQDQRSKCVCARAGTQGSYFEGDLVNVGVCPTITVQYHHSGNCLTAHRMLNRLWTRWPDN